MSLSIVGPRLDTTPYLQHELSADVYSSRVSGAQDTRRTQEQGGRRDYISAGPAPPPHLASPFVHAHRPSKPSKVFVCDFFPSFHLFILGTRTKHLHALYLPRLPTLIAFPPPTAYSLGFSYTSLMHSALLARKHWWKTSCGIPEVH